MRKRIGLAVILAWLSLTTTAFAADWKLNIHVSPENGGLFSGEMWYNNNMVWRLKIQTDGAVPAISTNDSEATVLVPDIVGGLFVLKVHR
ncbi:MAG: hypothetical protein E6X17_12050 [Sporomusaceae bacterium]|nr:hypothetical protein [Sporomusaceae bacterium]